MAAPFRLLRMFMLVRRSARWPRPRTPSGLLLLALLPAQPAASGIAGVCPDGSVFIVQRSEAIPCANAKRVEPHEVPPVRPEFLPRPYTWEVYEEGSDPNNPYNLIDAAREVRALKGGGSVPRDPPVQAAPGPGGPARAGSGAAVPAGPAQPQAASTLGLDEDALRDLFLIIEISQEHVPAAFRKETADAREAFTLSLAYSPAFERHVRERHPRAAELGGAPILIFSAVARRAEAFYGNLTFSQGHLAFSPDPGSSLQLGVLQGRLGELEAGEVVLGYVALPERMELHQPVGIYWNDRHTEVAFLP